MSAPNIAPLPQIGPVDPTFFALLRRGARGEVAALWEMADANFESGIARGALLLVMEGLVYARLAASRGDVGDQGRLVGMLAMAEDMCVKNGNLFRLAIALRAEGLARASIEADMRGAPIDTLLDDAVAQSDPRAVAFSQHIRKALLQAAEG